MIQRPFVIRVYSDLNCPFCFVLHERLRKLPDRDRFVWRLIEHAPNLASACNTREQLEQLSVETKLAQQRAQDVTLVKPDFCVNSRLAILSYLAVQAAHPALASAYLTRLYRAYWQEQQDISRYEVLTALLHELGLAWLDPDDDLQQRQLTDQRAWQTGDFDNRIPALHAYDNRVMLGLQNSYNVINFGMGISLKHPAPADTCFYSGLHRLALFGIAEQVRTKLKRLPDFACQDFLDLSALINAVIDEQVDAVIISSSEQAIALLTRLKEGMPKERPVPVVFIGGRHQETLEALVFDLGASDFISESSDFGSFRARLNSRIGSHKTLALLARHAHIDELTGLSNRRSFEQHLERAWRQGCRYQQTLAVIILDCDYFKAYNDSYGHFSGDECLRRLSDSLAAQVRRPTDVVARLGGEEFVILLPDTTADDAFKLAERARQGIADLELPHSGSCRGIVTLSGGVATTVPHADHTPLALMEEADHALYQAKANGRNACEMRVLSPPKVPCQVTLV